MTVCVGEGTVHERPIKAYHIWSNRHYPTTARNKGNLPPKLLVLPPPRPRPNKGLKKGVRGKVGGDWWSGFFGERLRYCGPGPRPWRKGQEGLPDRAAGAGKPEAAVPAPRRRRLRPGPPPTGNRSPGEAHRLLGAEAVEFGGGRGAEAGAEVGALCPRVRPPCLGPAAKGPGGHGCEAPPTLLQTRTA